MVCRWLDLQAFVVFYTLFALIFWNAALQLLPETNCDKHGLSVLSKKRDRSDYCGLVLYEARYLKDFK